MKTLNLYQKDWRIIMKKIAVYLIAIVLIGVTFSFSIPDTTCTISAKADQSATLMKRYKKLVKKCKKKYPCDGTQYEMNRDACNQYSAWDKELNYVYSKIFKSLSASRKKELKKSQISWIRKKEKAAKADAAQWKGGSAEPMIYYLSLASSTQKRVRWLIQNYA